ncbi:SAF domain-containing protein [Nocardioides perillae]|uniref:SAF domain-containing protein n=1 Tax=Nocardioides perillae TaxID=1119534 RepID=A0A7Y9US23_9ACTN|nr:hypothetical protein [Nocardioides perillae]
MSTDTTTPTDAGTRGARGPRRSRDKQPASRGSSAPGRTVEPPRQRRPALAALAVVLVVGGALLAGVLAVRMDERVPVLAAAREIPPGTEITAADLVEVAVASDGLDVLPAAAVDQVLGAYSVSTIPQGSLVNAGNLSTQAPVGDGRAQVSVPLNPALTPTGLTTGDLVEVVRVSGGNVTRARVLTEGLVVDVDGGSADDLGGIQLGTVTLLVPTEVAAEVVDAAGADLAGLALLERGQPVDTDLEVGS